MARELDRSGCPKTPAQAAVQVNIVGRDGSVGPPLFISPQTSQSGSFRLAQVPTGSHVHNRNIYCQVRIMLSPRIISYICMVCCKCIVTVFS